MVKVPSVKEFMTSIVGVAVIVGVISTVNYLSPVRKYVREGEKAKASGDYGLALEKYTLALNTSPENFDLQVKIAEVMLSMRTYEKAEEMLKALLEKNPSREKNLNPLLAKARLGMAKIAIPRNPTLAMSYLELAHKYDPDNPEVKKLLAEELFFAAINAYYNSLYQSSQNTDTGWQEKLSQAITLDPNPVYKVEFAKRYLERNRLEDFERTLAHLSEEDLANEDAQFELGMAILRFTVRCEVEGKAVLGNQYLNKGLEIMPHNLNLLLDKTKREYQQGKREEALQFASGTGLTPQGKELLHNYWLALEGNQFVKATRVFELPGQAKPALFNTDVGFKLVYVAAKDPYESPQKVMEVDLVSGKSAQLARVEGVVENFFLTRENNLIYIHSALNRDHRGNVRIAKADSLVITGTDGQSKVLMEKQLSQPFSTRLSPDSRYLAVGDGDAYVLLELEGLQIKNRQTLGIRPEKAVWSPDSTKILLTENNTSMQTYRTTELDVRTGNAKVLSDTNPAAQIAWAPDGRYVVRSPAGRQLIRVQNLELVDSVTGASTPLLAKSIYRATVHPYDYLFNWVGLITRDEIFPVWSPDGKFAVLGYSGMYYWILEKDTGVPFPIATQGSFLGWSGPEKLVFAADYPGSATRVSELTLAR